MEIIGSIEGRKSVTAKLNKVQLSMGSIKETGSAGFGGQKWSYATESDMGAIYRPMMKVDQWVLLQGFSQNSFGQTVYRTSFVCVETDGVISLDQLTDLKPDSIVSKKNQFQEYGGATSYLSRYGKYRIFAIKGEEDNDGVNLQHAKNVNPYREMFIYKLDLFGERKSNAISEVNEFMGKKPSVDFTREDWLKATSFLYSIGQRS